MTCVFLLVNPDGDKQQSSIISLRIFYKPETGKIYLHSYRQNVIADKQEVPGTLSISLESCGGHMDRGMAGWYTTPRVLKQRQALAQLKEPVEPDVESMLEETGYIDSDAAMEGLRKNTALTQDLLAQMLKYDFFEDRYARDIAHLAQQRGWTDVVNAVTNDPRASSDVHQIAARSATPGSGDTGEVPARDGRRKATDRGDGKLGVYGGYKLDSGYIPTGHVEYMYCMHPGMATESLAQNPYTPDEVLVDILKNRSHYRGVITMLAVNPTTPQEVVEKIFFRDYPADLASLRAVLPEVSSCDHRLTSSVRKYALFQAQSSCTDDHDEDVRDLIQGARNKDSITLDCAAYRERTLARLHPEVEIRSYGKIDYKPHFADDDALGGEYSIAEPSDQLNAEDGMWFGVIYLLGGDEYYRLIGNETQIDQIVIGPDGEAVTEAVLSSSSRVLNEQDSELFHLHHYYVFYKQIDDADTIAKGRWVFRLQHKGDVLAEQAITLQ